MDETATEQQQDRVSSLQSILRSMTPTPPAPASAETTPRRSTLPPISKSRSDELWNRPPTEAEREEDRQRMWALTAAKLGANYAPPIRARSDGSVVYGALSINGFKLHGPAEDQGRQYRVKKQLSELGHNMAAEVAAGRNLILAGWVGTGKDHLLTALLKRAVDLDIRVRWENGVALWRRLRDSWDNRTPEDRIMQPFVSPDVKVFALSDPLPHGTQKVWDAKEKRHVEQPLPLSKSETDMLFEIVDQRNRNKLATWINCNVADEDEAARRFGPQIWSRLKDRAIVLWCKWQSYRVPTVE